MMRIPGLESIGWALLNSFWQFGLLTLLYLLLTARDTRFSAAVRHNIAFSFSLAGSAWFIASLFFTESPAAVLTVIAPETTATGTPPSGGFLTIASFLSLVNQLVAFLPWVYVVILLLRTGHFFAGTIKKKKPAEEIQTPVAPTEWGSFLDRCRRELGIRRAVLLRWTGGHGMARTYGFFRPVVLFPVALLSRLSVAQVEAIMVHELAHIRRNDYVFHLWMSLFRFVFYFNPFAVFLYDAVSGEREKACDDLVLRRAYPAVVYASALMTLEQFRQSQLKMTLAASGHRPLQLADRIRRIAGLPVSPAPHRTMFRLMLAVFLTAVLFYAFRPVSETAKPYKKTTGTVAGPTVIKFQPEKFSPALVASAAPPLALPEIKVRIVPERALTFTIVPSPAPPSGTTRAEAQNTGSPDDRAADLNVGTYETNDQTEAFADSAAPDPASLFSIAEDVPAISEDADIVSGQPAFATKKIARNFSYRNPETAAVPVPDRSQPYVPATILEYPVPDSVPVIAMQSLRQNKTAVVQLLAKWKALQWQQNISRTLESRYLQLKVRALRDLKTLPAKKEDLRKSLQNLREQMRIRQAEIDRLSSILAEEPVIYI